MKNKSLSIFIYLSAGRNTEQIKSSESLIPVALAITYSKVDIYYLNLGVLTFFVLYLKVLLEYSIVFYATLVKIVIISILVLARIIFNLTD